MIALYHLIFELLKFQYIPKNHNHLDRTFDSYILKSETIKSATLILLSKAGLCRTFDRLRFWRYPFSLL